MTKDELIGLEKYVSAELDARRGLGGYSVEAENIIKIWAVLLKLARELRESAPAPKK